MTNSIKDALTAIADAIRKRTGKTEKMKVADMPAEIASIPAGGHDKEIVEGTITDYKSDEVTQVRNHAFLSVSKLISIDLPAATSIGIRAFYGCNALETVNFPAATSINSEAFAYSGLTAIDLPAATSIGDDAFSYCYSLKTADLPAATSIVGYAFYYCSELASVKIGSKNPNVCTLSNSGAFTGTKIQKGTGFIYVPDALVDVYKTSTNWSVYANQIKPLSKATTT